MAAMTWRPRHHVKRLAEALCVARCVATRAAAMDVDDDYENVPARGAAKARGARHRAPGCPVAC